MRKRARHLRRCKQVLWSRWSGEYLKLLRERHNLKHKTKDMAVQPGDVVLIQGPERNRGKWNVGIVTKLIKGRDGVVRAIWLRAGKSCLERAVQHLYPMELSCDQQREEQKEAGGVSTLNASAREFRPIRNAAIIYSSWKYSSSCMWRSSRKLNIERFSLNIALLEYLIKLLRSNRGVCRDSSYANYIKFL